MFGHLHDFENKTFEKSPGVFFALIRNILVFTLLTRRYTRIQFQPLKERIEIFGRSRISARQSERHNGLRAAFDHGRAALLEFEAVIFVVVGLHFND